MRVGVDFLAAATSPDLADSHRVLLRSYAVLVSLADGAFQYVDCRRVLSRQRRFVRRERNYSGAFSSDNGDMEGKRVNHP